ncbi:MAG TPA: MurT ligase domain-containing protein [Thermomicrobiales bacterium]|nr:MurT ligase domain-containing protein [Thermomicrobiales bacterium]
MANPHPESPPAGRRLPDVRLGAAIAAAKLTSAGIRRAGRGGGTAAPGLIADRIDPALLTKLAGRLPQGAVVVAGTNGKTTTSRMLADILEAAGIRVVHNRSGSNLVRGVAAAFADHASVTGRPRGDAAVVESDEAALPAVVELLRPRLILLNNLFRDQLDRYGELNTIATRWQSALERLPATTTLVVNVDDPTLAAMTDGLAARRIGFGLDESRYQLEALPHAADAATCRRCGADLVYDALYVSHLGAWRCPVCGNARPALDAAGTEVALNGVDSLRVTLTGREAQPLTLDVGIPGLYNVYNAVAAATTARALGVADETIARALAGFRAAFGRIERVALRGRTLVLALVKNPVGFNEVLRMLTTSGGLAVPTLIAINDLDADGRDVSWLWDVDFELLAEGAAPVSTTGIRGADMANRLKYAGVPSPRITPLPTDLRQALDVFVASVPEGETGYVLPTYTAMLELRRVLAGLGAVETFWKQ